MFKKKAYRGYYFGIVVRITILVLLLAGGASALSASTIQLPQTGQTKCYDTQGTEIPCTGTGQDGGIQAGAAWPNPRFVDNNDGTITDILTGLMWLKGGNCFGQQTWSGSLDKIADFNAHPNSYACQDYIATYTDWRLPNINELESLLNTDQAYPSTWLNNQGFKNVQYDWYWSSTTRAATASMPSADSAWTMSMMVGWINTGGKEGGSGHYFWPVRAGQFGSSDPKYPANIWKTGQKTSYHAGDDGDIQAGVSWPIDRFTNNPDGTVTDGLTGLTWTKDTNSPTIGSCSLESNTWQEALDYVKCLNSNNYLSHNDWRIPNRKELYSLFDYSQYNPALPSGHPFTNLGLDIGNHNAWTSTTIATNPSSYGYSLVWLMQIMNEGGIGGAYKNGWPGYPYFVWPVRGESGTPTTDAPPLTVSITSPTDNSYSEESVSFSGTTNGGTPPYTYTWKSNKDGILSTGESSDFNGKLTIGTHSISLTVKDSSKDNNPQTATMTLNVVKQVIDVNVLPVNFASYISGTTPSDLSSSKILDIGKQVSQYYLKSSYGTVYLNFKVLDKAIIDDQSRYSSIPLDKNHPFDRANAIRDDVRVLPKISSISPTEVILIDVNEDSYIGSAAGGNYAIVNRDNLHNTWEHEIGHTLGYVVETSRTYPQEDNLHDLYTTDREVYYWDIMGLGMNVLSPTNQISPIDLSSFSKLWLNWLVPNSISYGEHPLKPLEKNKYGGDVYVFGDSKLSYIIEARDLPENYIPDIRTDGNLENGVVIYKTENIDLFSKKPPANADWKINFVDNWGTNNLRDDPTLSTAPGMSNEYFDLSRFVDFRITSVSNDPYYQPTVKIGGAGEKAKNMVGAVISGISGAIGSISGNPFRSPGNIIGTSPDLDLHAYTPDGKHVGMNYTSGEYEMQIPGAAASGDLANGEEWIFVPKGTQVQYYVSSHDVQEYLKEHPEIDPANATMNYTTTLMEYGDNPQLTQLSDGNWTVTNRTISTPKENTIGPGVTNEILAYNFSGFLQPINADGSSIFKLGSTVNVKFQLRYPNRSFATNAVAKVYIAKINNSIIGTDTEANSTSNATIGNLARYDSTSNQYIFNWGTKGLITGTGTYQIKIELDDGTSKYVNVSLK